MRSIWKGFFNNQNLKTSLSNVILTNIIDETILLNNGRKNINFLIKSSMLYFKLGELIYTRKIGVKHKKKEKKNLKSKKKK
jgi:ribosomal protein S19